MNGLYHESLLYCKIIKDFELYKFKNYDFNLKRENIQNIHIFLFEFYVIIFLLIHELEQNIKDTGLERPE
jgi:hypothetical protein